MVTYKVSANLFFDNELDAKFVFDEMTKLETKVKNINEGVQNKTTEVSTFEYHKCYHDEAVPKKCEIIKKTIKNSDGTLFKENNTII